MANNYPTITVSARKKNSQTQAYNYVRIHSIKKEKKMEEVLINIKLIMLEKHNPVKEFFF